MKATPPDAQPPTTAGFPAHFILRWIGLYAGMGLLVSTVYQAIQLLGTGAGRAASLWVVPICLGYLGVAFITLYLQLKLLQGLRPTVSRWWITGPLAISLAALAWWLEGISARFVAVRVLLEFLAAPISLLPGGMVSPALAYCGMCALFALAQGAALHFEVERTFHWIAVNIGGVLCAMIPLLLLQAVVFRVDVVNQTTIIGGGIAVVLTTVMYGLFGTVTGVGIFRLTRSHPQQRSISTQGTVLPTSL